MLMLKNCQLILFPLAVCLQGHRDANLLSKLKDFQAWLANKCPIDDPNSADVGQLFCLLLNVLRSEREW